MIRCQLPVAFHLTLHFVGIQKIFKEERMSLRGSPRLVEPYIILTSLATQIMRTCCQFRNVNTIIFVHHLIETLLKFPHQPLNSSWHPSFLKPRTANAFSQNFLDEGLLNRFLAMEAMTCLALDRLKMLPEICLSPWELPDWFDQHMVCVCNLKRIAQGRTDTTERA